MSEPSLAEQVSWALLQPSPEHSVRDRALALVKVARELRGTMDLSALERLLRQAWACVWVDYSAALTLEPLASDEPESRTFALRAGRPLVSVPAHMERVHGRVDRWRHFEPQVTAPDGAVDELKRRLQRELAELFWLDEDEDNIDDLLEELRETDARRVLLVDLSQSPCDPRDIAEARNQFPDARIVFTCRARVSEATQVPGAQIVLPEVRAETEKAAWRALKDAYDAGGLGRLEPPKIEFSGG